MFKVRYNFSFSNGVVFTDIQLEENARLREDRFKKFLSRRISSAETYLKAIEGLISECRRTGILNNTLDFFALTDLRVFDHLCWELKDGKLKNFNLKQSSGAPHACIKSHYIPFLQLYRRIDQNDLDSLLEEDELSQEEHISFSLMDRQKSAEKMTQIYTESRFNNKSNEERMENKHISFFFPNGKTFNGIFLEENARLREDQFKKFLSGRISSGWAFLYLDALKKLPRECEKLGILSNDFDFFSLTDIEVLTSLCWELKSGSLKQYNKLQSDGAPHACIKSHYIPFLQSLKDKTLGYQSPIQNISESDNVQVRKKSFEIIQSFPHTKMESKIHFNHSSSEMIGEMKTFQTTFLFSNGAIFNPIFLDASANQRRIEFRNFLYSRIRSVDSYLNGIEKLPAECKKLGMLSNDFDFFSLTDIEVLFTLCWELKDGKLKDFNLRQSRGAPHACIKSHYIPFLLHK